jgi:hypothetical protein
MAIRLSVTAHPRSLQFITGEGFFVGWRFSFRAIRRFFFRVFRWVRPADHFRFWVTHEDHGTQRGLLIGALEPLPGAELT